MNVSPWARRVFGEHAGPLQEQIPEALRRAHEFAAAAQASSGTEKRDPYGHTLKNTQHECLVTAVTACLPPGAVTMVRPPGASYELLRFSEIRVVLYPWRYGSSSADRRESVRMGTSGTRQNLLAGVVGNPGQLTLEQARMSEQELDAQLADDASALEQLRTLARVVIVAYASNPKALVSLGWGEADLTDKQGTLHWSHWEHLPLPGTGEGGATGTGSSAPPSRPPVLPVNGAPVREAPRFDHPALDNDLGLSPRRPHSDEPVHEPEPGQQDTGTDQTAADDRP